MATLKEPHTPEQIKKLGLAATRAAYAELTDSYTKILDGDFQRCPMCGEWLKSTTSFYMDKRWFGDRFYLCKRCVMKLVEQRKRDDDPPRETKESVQMVLQMMDKCYDDEFYSDCVKGAQEALKEKNRISPFSTYFTALQSLPQWRNKTWKDSNFGEDAFIKSEEDQRTPRPEIQKLFGTSFTPKDLLYLQDQYDDWRTRTQVDSKSQEVYVTQICLQLLDIEKDRKAGKDVSNKLKALDTLMNAANLQPKQNVANSATDSLTFGQLIEKWETEKPIPEPSEEFKDVDGIGKYIRVWFSGWLSKALNLKNAYSDECEEYIKQYMVSPPNYKDEESSDDIYSQIFGTDGAE